MPLLGAKIDMPSAVPITQKNCTLTHQYGTIFVWVGTCYCNCVRYVDRFGWVSIASGGPRVSRPMPLPPECKYVY